MSHKNKMFKLVSATAASFTLVTTTHAVPTQVSAFDTPGCDVLSVPTLVDELGNPPVFPGNELISSQSLGPSLIFACPSMAMAVPGSVVVGMTNLTTTTWSNVWYVADFQTKITNINGLVNAG